LIYLSITVFRYSYTIDQLIYSMKSFKLKNNLIVLNWLLSIDASTNIQRNYFQAIKAFCELIDKCLMNLFRKLNRKLNLVCWWDRGTWNIRTMQLNWKINSVRLLLLLV